MEIKCKICGTVNDGETNFCKGCFVKLDSDKPVETNYNPKENEIEVPIEEEKEIVVPWEEENPDEKFVDTPKIEEPAKIEEDSVWGEPELKPMSEIEKVNEEVMAPAEEVKQEVIEQPMDEKVSDPVEEVVLPIEEVKQEEVIVPTEEIVPEPVEEIVLPTEEVQEEVMDQPKVELNPLPVEELEVPVEEEINSDDLVKENEVIEEPIPELSEFENWNDNEMPQLEVKPQEPVVQASESDWADDVAENESNTIEYDYVGIGKLYVKCLINCLIFGIIFGAVCIGFRYLMTNTFNMGTRGELIFIVISSVATVATLLISVDRTFKKSIPLASKINTLSFLILLFIALPYILIKVAYNLYIGTTIVILLILLALALIILAIFFNYMRNNIRKKHDIKTEDKLSFIYGIISIILVIGVLVGVYMYKDKDRDISFDILLNSEANKQAVMDYIYQVEKVMSEKQTEEGSIIPNLTSDVSDAEVEGTTPDEMTLYLNDSGQVTSGVVVYKGITYTYDGQTIKAE